MTTTRHTIRLSHLTTVDGGTRSARRVPELAVDHPAASWMILPGVEIGADGRHALRVDHSHMPDDQAGALVADFRYPTLPCWPCSVTQYRWAMRDCYDQLCDSLTLSVMIAGQRVELPASREYQRLFAEMTVDAELGSCTDKDEWVLRVIGGEARLDKDEV